jgi:DNA repair photolyase
MAATTSVNVTTLENFSGEGLDCEVFPVESKIQAREIRCSSLLHEMNFGSTIEYTINQYRGCTHGCNYCYAPSLIHDDRSWGSYVDVKINAHHVLDRELDRARKMVVFVSSASDPYQPVEARYKVTQKVLKVLAGHQFPVLLLTRSPLVLRDLDILQNIDWVRVGFSISSVSSRFYEPGVPSLERRIEALAKLHDHGIRTFVSMAPIIPTLILSDLDQLFDKLKEAGLSTISFGLLRFNGYEKSRQMFEERSGRNTLEVMAGGLSVYQEVKAKAMNHGLDTTGSILSWDPDNSSDSMSSIESYAKQGEPFSN